MSTPHYSDDSVTLYHGDCLGVLRELPDASVHSVVTDPPYGLGFMGKEWDSGKSFVERKAAKRNTFDHVGGNHNPTSSTDAARTRRVESKRFGEWCTAWATECLRVLKPGGHLLAFGGSRTWHRLAVAIEDAGFELRDSIAWLYAQGFSKSWNFSTQYQGEWCPCEGGKPVEYNHADNTDLHRMWNPIHPPAVTRGEGEGADLLEGMQWQEPSAGTSEARPQVAGGMAPGSGRALAEADDRAIEPVMAGGLIHRAGQGLSDDTDAGSPEGEGEWLRGRTSTRNGGVDWKAGDAARGGASHQSRSGGQPAGESDSLSEPHGALDDGALRGRATCARCGGLRQEFRGFGTGLKPAFEPVVVARKPLSGTVAATVLEHGTGALNIDGCRVATTDTLTGSGTPPLQYGGANHRPFHDAAEPRGVTQNPAGRWPTNVVLDDHMAAMLDEQSGVTTSGSRKAGDYGLMGYMGADVAPMPAVSGDSGGLSRMFPVFRYEPKATTAERPRVDGIAHPTVKPLDLMRWLVRLVTPPGGVVLDPFAGSGTTLEAAVTEGFKAIGVEMTSDYLPLIVSRLDKPIQTGFNFDGEAS